MRIIKKFESFTSKELEEMVDKTSFSNTDEKRHKKLIRILLDRIKNLSGDNLNKQIDILIDWVRESTGGDKYKHNYPGNIEEEREKIINFLKILKN